MNTRLGRLAAAAALMASLAAAPALAQTNNIGSSPDAAAPEAAGEDTLPATSEAARAGFLSAQSPTQIRVSHYLGQPIHNADNKTIGEIKDLILDEGGGMVAAVIGVGGFLGIGEKDVAVPMDRINLSRDVNESDGTVRLSTAETAEALQAAPPFRMRDDGRARTDSTTTSSTADDGAAPAKP